MEQSAEWTFEGSLEPVKKYGLTGSTAVINVAYMLVYEQSGLQVKLSGTADSYNSSQT